MFVYGQTERFIDNGSSSGIMDDVVGGLFA